MFEEIQDSLIKKISYSLIRISSSNCSILFLTERAFKSAHVIFLSQDSFERSGGNDLNQFRASSFKKKRP